MERYSMLIYGKNQYCKKCPKLSTDSMQSFIKMPLAFFTGIEQMFLKFVCNHKRLQIAEAILKKNKFGGIMLFSNYITKLWQSKQLWHWPKKTHRSLEQNRKTQIHEHMTKVLRIYSGEKIICSIKYVGETGQPHAKKKKKKRTGTHSYTIHKS